MEINSTHSLIEAVISFLKENGKSKDIASLLMSVKVDEPSIIHDFMIELSLAVSPMEEEGLGCISVSRIEQAFNEFKETGITELLNSVKWGE